MEKIQYVKCPKCDVNYMKSTEKTCDVCIAELKRKLGASEEEDDDRVLCPVCSQNYLELDEEMCASCLAEKEEEEVVPVVEEDKWREYLDEDKDLPVAVQEISLDELDEEENKDKDAKLYPDEFDN